MTDLERTIELLTSFEVEFSRQDDIKDGDIFTTLLLEAGTRKVIGYTGFYSTFNFDKHGRFLSVGAWE